MVIGQDQATDSVASPRVRRYAIGRRLRPGLWSPGTGEGVPIGSEDGVPPPPVTLRRRKPKLSGFAALITAADLAAFALAWALVPIKPTVALVTGAVGLVLIASGGLYRARLTLSALEGFPALLGRIVVAGAVGQTAGDLVEHEAPVLNVIAMAVVWAVTMSVTRALAYAHVRSRRSSLRAFHPTLILGAGLIGTRIATVLRNHPEYGLHPVGFVDDNPLISGTDVPAPVLGGKDDLGRVISQTGSRDVVIAFSSLPDSQLVDVIRSCDRLDCEIYLIPRLFELHQPSAGTDRVWGIPVTRLPRTAFRSRMLVAKRGMDIVVAGLALVALIPVLVLCAIGACYETGGVIFRQQRVGIDGRPFNLLKFKSLRPADENESAVLWSVSADHRLGPVGRLLRRTSLDELPQLWNIVRGDMSLVGPRPERPYFAGQFAGAFPRYSARTRVVAGLTGWAQVHNLRGDTSIEDRVTFDNHYIEHWSLWGDVKILLRTVMSVVRAAGS